MPSLRALLVALATFAAAPAARAQSPASLWSRVTSPRARDAAEAARAGEWIQLLDGLPEPVRARLSPERDDVSHDTLRRDALAQLERSLALRPDDPRTLASAAQLRDHFRDLDGAARDAERALALDPDGPSAQESHLALALVHTRREEHAVARDHYLAVLRLPLREGTRALALGNLGDTYLALGDVASATASYQACVAVQPEFALGWLGLAVALDRALIDPGDAAATAVRVASDLAPRGWRRGGFDPGAIVDMLESEGVFFVPWTDGLYQLAIAHEAVARAYSPGNPFGAPPVAAEVARHRADAAEAWRRYLAATPNDDPWRARAEAHLRALGAVAR